MTRAEFARYMGVHKSQVSRWCERGLPVQPDGSIAPEPGRTWVRRHIDPTRRATAQHWVSPSRRDQPPEPDEGNPVNQAMIVVMIWLASKMPKAAAARALDAGVGRDEAARIYEFACAGAGAEVAEIAESLNIPCVTAASWSEWQHPGFDPMPEAA